MQTLTLRVLQGADRGRTFEGLRPPVTIGREEGNAVQLNDERISRFHVKIQEDDGKFVITDLESTNGTRINGHSVNLKILRNGDTISVGRTILLVGDREVTPIIDSSGDDDDLDRSTRIHAPSSNKIANEAMLPRALTAGQSAELRELLDFIHTGIRYVIENAKVDEKDARVTIDDQAWQKMLTTQSDISVLIRQIEDPQGGESQGQDTGRD